MKKILLSVTSLLFATGLIAQTPLFTENFDYPVGTDITGTLAGWTVNTGNANPLLVTSPGLTYTGYAQSGLGNKLTVNTTGYDAFKGFSGPVTSGTVYACFMANFTSAQATGDYFAALLPDNSTSLYTARLYARSATSGIEIGMTKGSGTPANYTAFNTATTYFIVIKYSFSGGTTSDDSVSAYVFNGAIPATEPTAPHIAFVTGGTDAANIGRFAIRQGNASNAPVLDMDGIRVVTSWSDINSGGAALVPQATDLTFSDVQTTSVKLAFNRTGYVDSLHHTLVFFKQDAAITQGTPDMNPVNYTAETDFQLATSVYQNDAAAKCVLSSDLDSVVITNLVPGKTYHALVYVVRNSDSVYSAAAINNVMTIDTATPPPAPEYPLYNISQISNTNLTTGVPDSMGVKVMLHGIATGFNQRTSGIAFVLTDATGGTTLFHPSKTFGYTVTEGDSIYVKGVVTTFRGLHEVNIDTLWKGGAATVTLTPSVVSTLNENTENKLVRLNNVRFLTVPTGTNFATSSTNYPVVTSANDTFTMRVLSTSALAGQPLPTTPSFNIIGMGAQFSTSSAAPFAFNGYQLFPRTSADIIDFVPPPVERPVTIASINSTNLTTGEPDSVGAKVFVHGIVLGFNQRTSGVQFVLDDGTSGITLFHFTNNFGYTVTEGDSIYAKGTVATYRGLSEINLDTLWKVPGNTAVYTPFSVPVLNETSENRLVKLDNVRFVSTPSGTNFGTSSTNYPIVTSNNDTFTLRVLSTSALAGQPLPTTAAFSVIGLGAQFSTSSSSPYAFNGYQIYPRRASDIIEAGNPQQNDSIGDFNLVSVANNTVISVEDPFNDNYTISWSRPALFGSIDSITYYLNIDTIGGNFSNSTSIFTSNGDPDDTTFTLSEESVRLFLTSKGLIPGQTYYGKWQVSAETNTMSKVSNQTFNITFDFVLNNGLSQIAFDKQLSLYPNPAAQVVHISHKEALSHVEIFNFAGQRITSKQLEGANSTQLNLSDLNSGLYFITVYSNSGSSATRKLIIE